MAVRIHRCEIIWSLFYECACGINTTYTAFSEETGNYYRAYHINKRKLRENLNVTPMCDAIHLN